LAKNVLKWVSVYKTMARDMFRRPKVDKGMGTKWFRGDQDVGL